MRTMSLRRHVRLAVNMKKQVTDTTPRVMKGGLFFFGGLMALGLIAFGLPEFYDKHYLLITIFFFGIAVYGGGIWANLLMDLMYDDRR